MTYRDQLTEAMTMLGRHPRTVFLGQAVAYPGTGMFATLRGVPMEKRIELPVFEDAQLGMAIGLSLNGFIPVCIYPRINFLLLAMNQLVNHLDKLEEFGNGWQPRVLIRTMVAHDEPMNPGIQHLGDYTAALQMMLRNVSVIDLEEGCDVLDYYQTALDSLDSESAILVERAALYDTAREEGS